MHVGVTENLCGPEEVEAFRRARPSAGLARRINLLGFEPLLYQDGITGLEGRGYLAPKP